MKLEGSIFFDPLKLVSLSANRGRHRLTTKLAAEIQTQQVSYARA